MINDRQKRLVRHALGLDGTRRSTYRNRWITHPNSDDRDEWQALVDQGLAQKKPWGNAGMEIFWATKKLALSVLDSGERLDREDFGEVAV